MRAAFFARPSDYSQYGVIGAPGESRSIAPLRMTNKNNSGLSRVQDGKSKNHAFSHEVARRSLNPAYSRFGNRLVNSAKVLKSF